MSLNPYVCYTILAKQVPKRKNTRVWETTIIFRNWVLRQEKNQSSTALVIQR
jgi:hypothetical protein